MTMTLRRAIRRQREILAECPYEGACSTMQCHRGVIWFSCPCYGGLVESEQGVMVKCRLDEEE